MSNDVLVGEFDDGADDALSTSGKSDEVEAVAFTSVKCPYPGCSVVGTTVPGVRRHITKIHKASGQSVDLVTEVNYGATVYGPNGDKVRVIFYPHDGSLRFRVHEAGPMKITEAFLPGVGKHVIIKLEK